MFKAIYDFFFNYFKLFTGRDSRLLMLGLDGAGKTTLLYRLKIGEEISTVPTIGFNVESIKYKNVMMTVWDIGGQTKIRDLWKHYFYNTNGLVFLIDSNDRERLGEVKETMDYLRTHEELKKVPFLIMANKQDIKGCLSLEEIIEALELQNCKERKWYVQKLCAINGEGAYEGLEWLSKNM
ncbi:hypothetical protein DICPUDRAFT_87458 [Dictyostelium purpureum]|uniref:ADP-ribosylation factor n=1 Tax=Dictyostelium purpureum TaxID=5786 RepID=F0ZI92_DICPU|nr:uncharacterized protein DICPUDRAFT_87458 [Dictyostelium purpureum]EGC36315.1 hypothetical protein DICPUDRAFT_87458 [Dictyostelium purpureum]|eukprot:XP_003287130.1 hypothetical protein DICPUDRAFT_87458 [Dictyostelium purpureum]